MKKILIFLLFPLFLISEVGENNSSNTIDIKVTDINETKEVKHPQTRKNEEVVDITAELEDEIKKEKNDDKLDKINIYKDIFLAIDSELKMNIDDIFLSQKYKNFTLKGIESIGSLEAINNLRKSKANISIVRGDVLGIKKNGIFGIEPYEDFGIICSPNRSVLYLVSKYDITSINDLRDRIVSTGLVSNMAQLYLNDITKNSGVELDISFRSLDISDSIDALLNDDIDVLFAFAPENYVLNFTTNGLKVQSLPDDFLTNLNYTKGINPHRYELNGKRIRTYETPNFIIAPTQTLDENINLKIEAMVSAFKCYKTIQNIDSFYGKLHDDVKKSISKIHKRLDKQSAIKFVFKRDVKVKNSVKHIYEIQNNSKADQNITFLQFRTKKFDKIPIKPRHLISIIPNKMIKLKAGSKRILTFTYKNPFLEKIPKRKIETVFINKTEKNKEIKFFLTIGDEE